MAKNRVNKKELRRLQLKARHANGIDIANRVRFLAEQLPNNQSLRTVLMQEPDPEKRKRLFDFMLPFLKFGNPEFPSIIEGSRIIRP